MLLMQVMISAFPALQLPIHLCLKELSLNLVFLPLSPVSCTSPSVEKWEHGFGFGPKSWPLSLLSRVSYRQTVQRQNKSFKGISNMELQSLAACKP